MHPIISSKRIGRSFFLAAGLMAALSACATDGAGTKTSVAKAAPAAPGQTMDERIGKLAPQALADGSCGMFLWSRGNHRNLVFFTSDRTSQAKIVFDGAEVSLPRTLAEGDHLFGQYTEQRFGDGTLSLRLLVQPDPQAGVIGGALVRQGMLTVRDGAGWDLVLPVAGLIACKGG